MKRWWRCQRVLRRRGREETTSTSPTSTRITRRREKGAGSLMMLTKTVLWWIRGRSCLSLSSTKWPSSVSPVRHLSASCNHPNPPATTSPWAALRPEAAWALIIKACSRIISCCSTSTSKICRSARSRVWVDGVRSNWSLTVVCCRLSRIWRCMIRSTCWAAQLSRKARIKGSYFRFKAIEKCCKTVKECNSRPLPCSSTIACRIRTISSKSENRTRWWSQIIACTCTTRFERRLAIHRSRLCTRTHRWRRILSCKRWWGWRTQDSSSWQQRMKIMALHLQKRV